MMSTLVRRSGYFAPLVASTSLLLCTFALFISAQPSYAATVDAQSLYIAQAELIAVPSPDGTTARMVETIEFHNGTHKAVSVTLPLLAGVKSPVLLPSPGWTMAGGVLHNSNLPPGDSAVMVRLHATLAGQSAVFSFISPYSVREYFVVVPQGSLFVSAQGGFLTSSASFLNKGVAFRRFVKLDVPSHVPWSLSLTLLPTAAGRQTPLPKGLPVLNAYSSHSADFEAAANLALAAAILIVGMISIQSAGLDRSKRGQFARNNRRSELLIEREAVLGAWVELERTHRGDADYEVRRNEYSRRAEDIDMALGQRLTEV